MVTKNEDSVVIDQSFSDMARVYLADLWVPGLGY